MKQTSSNRLWAGWPKDVWSKSEVHGTVALPNLMEMVMSDGIVGGDVMDTLVDRWWGLERASDPARLVTELTRKLSGLSFGQDDAVILASRIELSKVLFEVGRFSDARSCLQECIEMLSLDSESAAFEQRHVVKGLLAEAHVSIGEVDSAMELWADILGRSPSDNASRLLEWVGFGLAEAHLLLGQLPDAAEIAASTCALFPAGGSAHTRWRFVSAVSELRRQHLKESGPQSRLEQALSEDPLLRMLDLLLSGRSSEARILGESLAQGAASHPLYLGWLQLLMAQACNMEGNLEACSEHVAAWEHLALRSPGWQMSAFAQALGANAASVQQVGSGDNMALLLAAAKLTKARFKKAMSAFRLHRSMKEVTQKKLEASSLQTQLSLPDAPPPSLLSELIRIRVPKFGVADVIDMQALGFHLVYQPFLHVSSMTVNGCEALLRLNHPSRGPMLPDQFISKLEDSGDIVEVGRWVALQSCAQMALWQQKLGRRVQVAINVAAKQLERPGFAEFIDVLLQHFGIPQGCLEVEITETMEVHDTAQVMQELGALRGVGVSISVDDFGIGHCNLARVLDLRAQKLKIDKSLVDKLNQSDRERKALRALVTSGLSLDMSVTAEGVETAQQALLLRDMNCTYLQGYLIGRPMVPKAIESNFLMESAVWESLLSKGNGVPA